MKENKTTAVEAKCAISVKNTYDNTKRFTIALWMLNKGVLGFANPLFITKTFLTFSVGHSKNECCRGD